MLQECSDITLCIATKNRYNMLFSLLRSLPLLPQRFAIQIVDNNAENVADDEAVRVADEVVREYIRLGTLLKETGFLGFEIIYAPELTSLLAVREEQIRCCRTKLAWIVDDDMVLLGNPLEEFYKAMQIVGSFSFLQGTKVDIENTEGYQDWSFSAGTSIEFGGGNIPKWFYLYKQPRLTVETVHLDEGFSIIDVATARKTGAYTLQHLPSEVAKGKASDVVAGPKLASAGLAYYVPRAQAFHFLKDKITFQKDPSWVIEELKKTCREDVLTRFLAFYKQKFNW